jgi:DNA mismatch repair protein MutS2
VPAAALRNFSLRAPDRALCMNFSGTELLQFDELKELVAGYAGSSAGRALVRALEAYRDGAALENALAEAGEAITYTRELSSAQQTGRGAAIRLRFDQIRDLEAPLRILQVEGAALDGSQILDIFHTLAIAGEYRVALLPVAERYPRLARRGQQLADLRDVTRRFSSAFLPDGSLADHASPTLAHIRRDAARQQKQIQDSLERFLRAHRTDGTLQQDFITIRESRYVVPVVTGQKSRVDGVIHGASGTGRTLFIEPLDTIGLNNRLVELREEELVEIERILREITNVLREHAPAIAASIETLAGLDCVFAKAAFASAYNAVVPRFSGSSRHLLLREARHPLLETVLRKQRKPIVPISFELNGESRCLLISGPNTGGKTVTLKTAGLLALMAHAAIPVPCAEAEFPLLEDVLADIGDTQSIAESLSTFSGHLLHIKDVLARATPDSLVLLDELGGATDPEDGGALGVAILDEFRKSGAFCLASTHLLPLKVYGASTAGVLNASMGFNDATLEPTYELRLGIPGKSAGLDIAARLEMPESILAHAHAVLPRMQADFQSLIGGLHQQAEENTRQTAKLQEAQRELEARRNDLEQQAARREALRRREWERKTEQVLADFQTRAQSAIDRISESTAGSKRAAEQAQRVISRARREFREEAARAAASEPTETQSAIRAAIQEGSRVRLKDVREIATVRRRLKNGMLEVDAGNLRMQIAPEDVTEVVTSAETAPHLPGNVRFAAGPPLENYREINLIGQRAEEAIEQVDKFLDSAALASINRVRIVHGHGMGVLKRAVGEYLATSPHVSRFYPAEQAEGGSGATIVELRD